MCAKCIVMIARYTKKYRTAKPAPSLGNMFMSIQNASCSYATAQKYAYCRKAPKTMSNTNDYWAGIDAIVVADLHLLDRVGEAIANAKAEAARVVTEGPNYYVGTILEPRVPYDLGALKPLYLRVLRSELERLREETANTASDAANEATLLDDAIANTLTALEKKT